MKIAYLMQTGVADLTTRPLSGPANHVHHVCCELRQLGHEVRIVMALENQIWVSDDGDHFDPIDVRWLGRGPFRLFERAVRRGQAALQIPYAGLFDSLRFAQACRQAVRGFDVMIERMGWMGYGGQLASLALGIPLVLEVNGDHLTEMEMLGLVPRPWQRRLSVAVTGFAARRAAHVVATGEGWRRRFLERWGGSPDRVSVVENGSELVHLLNRRDLPAFADSPAANGRLTAAYIGGFDPWHGLEILLPAAARARESGVDLHLLLIGDGAGRAGLERLAADLGLAPYLEITGHRRPVEFARDLIRAEIGVSPYCGRVEYSGLKLLDYKAAGLATIASGAGGQPAVIRDHQTGRIVPPCSVEALHAALVELAGDAERRRAMGRQARLEAEEQHSWRHTAEALVAIFNREIGR